MGRRKSTTKKTIKKKRPTVPTVFKCPYCNNDKSVECTLDMRTKIGDLNCRVCGASFETTITYLSDPIDVFSEWIDAAEDLKQAIDTADGDGGRAGVDDDDDA